MNPIARLITTAALALGAAGADGQNYSIVADTLGSGGGLATSASYSGRAVSGQHSAGTLAGSTYTVRSGFFPGAVARRPACPADLAPPYGLLDLADINAFVAGFHAQVPLADFDDNGLFDLADVTAFVSMFTAGCP